MTRAFANGCEVGATQIMFIHFHSIQNSEVEWKIEGTPKEVPGTAQEF
jgi:hypothetical protein